MKSYDFYSGLFLMALSVATCLKAYRLGLGNIDDPGPGLIPFGVGVLLGSMSIGLSIRSLFQAIKGHPERNIFKGIARKGVLLALSVILGCAITFNYLGLIICTFLMMVILLGAVSQYKWWLILILSLFIVLCTYLLFVVGLGLPLPRGSFWDKMGI
jgi:hypothetical protein